LTLASEVFKPDEWRDFFLEVGGAAAVLTGLVFVAMSINLDDVTHDATHRNRAIGTLTGMIAAFVICSDGGQGHVAIGVEWATVAAIAGAVYVSRYIRVPPTRRDPCRTALSLRTTRVEPR
jgi:modulator of FtsH protease